jgi:hypothetical protein
MPNDSSLGTITQKMCDMESARRPTARELVFNILQIEGPAQYYDFCCNQEHWSKTSFSETRPPEARYDKSLTWEDEEDLTVPSTLFEEPGLIDKPANFKEATVEDGDTTLRVPFNYPPHKAGQLLEEVTEFATPASLAPETVSIGSPVSASGEASASASLAPQSSALQDMDPNRSDRVLQPAAWPKDVRTASSLGPDARFPREAAAHGLPCPWPNCKPPDGLALVLFDGLQSLQLHLRGIHLVHELGRTRVMEDQPSPSRSTLTPKTGALIPCPGQKAHRNAGHSSDEETAGIWSERQARKSHPDNTASATRSSRRHHLIHAEIPAGPVITSTGEKTKLNAAGVPTATFVPSYIYGKYPEVLTHACH